MNNSNTQAQMHMTVRNKNTNLDIKRDHPIKDPQKKFQAPPVRHRTRITPENKVGMFVAKPVRKLLKEFRDGRALNSYTDSLEYLIFRVYDLEKLVLVLKEILDLTTEKEDYRFVQYGFNRKMTPELRFIFAELVGWSKNG